MFKKARMKIISIILSFLMLFGSFPGSAFKITSAYAAAPAGSGTANDPYKISSAADLDWMRTNYNTIKNSYFVQTNDIDLSGVTNFGPIGETTYWSGFSGTYDGAWHTISGLTITSANSNYVGLFMVIGNGGSVCNLKFTNVNINLASVRTEYIGTVAGSNAGTIENCYVVSGSVVGGKNTQAGGIAGSCGGTITSCYNAASISVGIFDARLPAAGGIVADVWGQVNNCWNSGNVSSTDNSAVRVGGIAGMTNAANGIVNCYSSGTISTGGGSAKAGGIIGSAFSGNLSANFYLTGKCAAGIGMLDNGGTSNIQANPKTDAELKTPTTFSGWDNIDTWFITSGSYPQLLTNAHTPVAVGAIGGTGSVTVSWQKAKRAGGYRIYWSETPGVYDEGTYQEALGYNATSATITGLTNWTTYYFVVKGVGDSDGLSSASNEVSATPSVTITNLACTPNNGKVDLTFSVPAGATDIVIEQSTDAISYVPANTGTLTDVSTTATVTGLTNGITYYFQLTVTISGHEVSSNTVSCKPTDAISGPTGYPELSIIPLLTQPRTKIMIGNDDYRAYAFKPSVAGEYTIYTEEPSRNTYIYVTQNDLDTFLGDSEDGGDTGIEENFKYVATLDAETTYYFAVYDYNVLSEIDICIAGPGMDPNAPVDIAPLPGDSGTIIAGNITQNSVDLTWTVATDDVSAQSNLLYKVVRSASNNLDTVDNAEANGTVVQDWSTGISSIQATGLTAGTTYYFNVIVKDETGNKALYTATSKQTLAAPAHVVIAEVGTETPMVGTNNTITFTVKDSLNSTDANFDGNKDVIVAGVLVAPGGTRGSFNATPLETSASGAGQTIPVTFSDGVGTANLVLHKTGTQTLLFSISGVTTPDTNALAISPTAGEVTSLEISQQPVPGAASGDAFATQPVVTLKDQYGNQCVDGPSATADVVATAKAGTGSYAIGGTTTIPAVAGAVSFTDLTCTLTTPGDGGMTFTSGAVTIESGTFTIPEFTAKTLTADTTANNVDNDIEVTFAADAAFEGAITGVSFNGNALTGNQYTVTSGKVILHPSNADNNYLRVPATGNVRISATGYGDASVGQTIEAGAVTSLEISQQPVPGAASGDAFVTQPVVTLKDQYGNQCVDGPSATANVVATAKAGTGSYAIGGTTTIPAVAGAVSFTDLTCTLTTPGAGGMTFTSGAVMIESGTFTIPEFTAKTLTADTTANNVDNDIEVTFAADAAFEGAITGVSFNGNALTGNQYTVTSGKVILHPSNADNNYLRVPATGNVRISASGYGDASVGQTIEAGAVTSLEISQQPVPGAASGDAFATQPVVTLKDQYGNQCVDGPSATADVVATAKAGTGTYAIGGTTTIPAVAGAVSFTDLTCTLTTPGDGGMTFTSGAVAIESGTFTIPEFTAKTLTADTTANNVDNDIEVTFAADAAFEGAITGVSFNGNALTGNQYTVTSGKVILHPSNADNNYLRVPATGNVRISATGYGDASVSQTINHGVAAALEVTENIIAPATSGGTFTQQPTITLKDVFGNICTDDNLTVVTASKKDEGNWTLTGVTTVTATNGVVRFAGLGATNATEITNAQMAFNAQGLSEVTSVSVTLLAPPSSRGHTNTPTETDAAVYVNGDAESAGKVETKRDGDLTITTVEVDSQKLETKLQSEGSNAVVTIPINAKSDVVRGELNGQMVKSMEEKAVVLEIKTEKVTYTLPAGEINIDAVSQQVGENVQLSDIIVQIEIAKVADDTVKVMEASSKKDNFAVIVPPVEFVITCSFGEKAVTVSQFNSYVERKVAIPEGVDPKKVTTGIVLEADGTIRHVPTKITIIDGKYYAQINSLTNSTYSVIWNPKEFKDVTSHWAKEAVNDMGSRLVISGVGRDMFEPDRAVTRAEFAAIVVRGLGLKPGVAKHTFNDVTEDAWYGGFIETAYKYGIISGYGQGKFGPNDKITREQAMTMVAKAMKITELSTELPAGEANQQLSAFTDAGTIADYAKTSIATCVKAGVVNGKNNALVAPKDNITRAEVAVLVRKLLQKSELI